MAVRTTLMWLILICLFSFSLNGQSSFGTVVLSNYSCTASNLIDTINYSLNKVIGSHTNQNALSLFSGSDMTPSTNWWGYGNGIEMSGYIYGRDAGNALWDSSNYESIALITPKHGVTAAHNWGNYTQYRTRGNDGNYYTNLVIASTNAFDDFELVTFSTNFPSAVVPFSIFPTNVSRYFAPPTLYSASLGVGTFVFRAEAALGTGSPMYTSSEAANSSPQYVILNEGTLISSSGAFDRTSSSSSGSPCFCLLGNTAVFVMSIHFSNLSGPFISYGPYCAAIQAAIAPATLTFVDLSTYQMLQ